MDESKKNLDTRRTTDFIPHHVAPDNWPLFGERSNPLSSKGESQTMGDYFDYEEQYYDYLDASQDDDYYYDE